MSPHAYASTLPDVKTPPRMVQERKSDERHHDISCINSVNPVQIPRRRSDIGIGRVYSVDPLERKWQCVVNSFFMVQLLPQAGSTPIVNGRTGYSCADAQHDSYWGEHKYNGPATSPGKVWAGVGGRPPLMVEVRVTILWSSNSKNVP